MKIAVGLAPFCGVALAKATWPAFIDTVAEDVFCRNIPASISAATPKLCPTQWPPAEEYDRKLKAAVNSTVNFLENMPDAEADRVISVLQQALEYLVPLTPSYDSLPHNHLVTFGGTLWLAARGTIHHARITFAIVNRIKSLQVRQQFMQDFCAFQRKVARVMDRLSPSPGIDGAGFVCINFPPQPEKDQGNWPRVLESYHEPGGPKDTSLAPATVPNSPVRRRARMIFHEWLCDDVPTVIAVHSSDEDRDCDSAEGWQVFVDKFWSNPLNIISQQFKQLHIRLARNTWIDTVELLRTMPPADVLSDSMGKRIWGTFYLQLRAFKKRPLFGVIELDLSADQFASFMRVFCRAVAYVNFNVRHVRELEPLHFAECPVVNFVMQPRRRDEQEIDITQNDLPIPSQSD